MTPQPCECSHREADTPHINQRWEKELLIPVGQQFHGDEEEKSRRTISSPTFQELWIQQAAVFNRIRRGTEKKQLEAGKLQSQNQQRLCIREF